MNETPKPNVAELMKGNPLMSLFGPLIDQATAGAAEFERKVMLALADIRAQQEQMLALLRK